MTHLSKVSLNEAFRKLDQPWSPVELVGVNDHVLTAALMKGRYKWHSHTVDELFYVINGEILIGIKDQPGMKLRAGELAVIPAGVEHCPESSGESRVLMFEKKTNKP